MNDATLTGQPDGPVLGIVVIGRNEGERLRRCLASCVGAARCVYVDSNSTDGSVGLARALGAEVVALDLLRGFTAARARNEGFQRLVALVPEVEFVQFVDGDCELFGDWMPRALAFLATHPDVVAVCGRRRERFPDASVFNRLCDIEWNTRPGEARACGGDVVMRAAALRAAGGYRDDLIAGEEPELCVRLRAAGGRIWRLDQDMTWHDAAMMTWTQWWRRNKRSGHAFAEGAFLHGQPPERHFVAETRRAMLWGAALPVAIVVLAATTAPSFLLLLLVYPVQWLRIGARFARAGGPIAWTHAAFLLMGRFPEAQGVLKFWFSRLRGQRSALIEYK
ncbi:MAG: glycosyltransferase [Burkholderiaceae bacterium]|jgi:GT2 family glycosyltransferase